MRTTIRVDPSGEFSDYIKTALEKIEDLRVPFALIEESWYRGNASIFALSGPGKFADLSPSYKRQKRKDTGSIYPILFRQEGRVKKALTVPGDPGGYIRREKKSLELGVDPKNDLFNWLHFGTKRMPARPYVLLGAEQVSPPELNRRVAGWQTMIINYVLDSVGAPRG